MKKFYAIIAMVMLTMSANAQVTYDFRTVAADDGTINYARNTISRQWDDKMYLFPIPQTELMKNPNLTQNPGW